MKICKDKFAPPFYLDVYMYLKIYSVFCLEKCNQTIEKGFLMPV